MKDKKKLKNNYNLGFILDVGEEHKKFISKIPFVEILTEETKHSEV